MAVAIEAEVFDDVRVQVTRPGFLEITEADSYSVVLNPEQVRQVVGYAIRAGLFEQSEVSA